LKRLRCRGSRGRWCWNRCGGAARRAPNAELVQKKKQQKPPAITYDDGKWVDPRRAARYLEDKLSKRDRILVFDGGHALMVAVQTLTSPGLDNWTTGADFGAVGQGLAIALGACFARPGKRITHVTADAAFMMNVAAFHTAVSHNLPLTVFVFNDNAAGQERHDLVHKGFPTKYAELHSRTSRNWRSGSAPRVSIGVQIWL
jgi:acetolactate synthase-1/2/3 large subunit